MTESLELGTDRLAEAMDARWWAMGILNSLDKAVQWEVGCEKIRNLVVLLEYADCRSHTGRRKRTPVNVDEMVPRWVEAIVGLSTAHDHAHRTAADHESDELLGPMLTAPVAQIRELAQKLAKALREDERVPFLVWSCFEQVLEPIIRKGPDGPVLALKVKLAAEVAELVEKGLDREELIVALAGALQWRGEQRLQAVKAELEAGQKPRLRGRESCLFLDAGKETVVI